MTKQEFKDEHIDIEGDPKVKARIRSIQMKMAQNRMMSKCSKGTCSCYKSYTYAVALQYDRTENPAPKVWLKVLILLRLRYVRFAQNNNVRL